MIKYKLRSDSTWSRLSAVQRNTLDDWLFEERLTYPKILERVQKEFGITGSRPSLCRYCDLRQQERALEDLAGADRTSKVLNGVKVNVTALRESSLKLIGKRLLMCALEGAAIGDLTGLARVLLDAQSREIQQERLELAREKFHFDAAEAALAEIPRMQEVTAEEYQKEKERVNGMLKRLFGALVPGKVPPTVEGIP
jgi:hypothetical protein